MLRSLFRQATRRRLPFSKEEALALGNPASTPTAARGARFISNTSQLPHGGASLNAWHRSTAYATSSALWACHRGLFLRWFSNDLYTDTGKPLPDASSVLHSSLQRTARTYASSHNTKKEKTQTKEENHQKDVSSQPNYEEMASTLEDMDVSPVTGELRQAQQEMIVRMRRCSYALLAVGAVHMIWGGVMFFALEEPLNHAVVTEVCMSSLVICGLAYQLRQTIKPVQLFANREEYDRMSTIFLCRQVSRMLGAFFHRGRGIAFVLSLTLGAHSLSCIRFLM